MLFISKYFFPTKAKNFQARKLQESVKMLAGKISEPKFNEQTNFTT